MSIKQAIEALDGLLQTIYGGRHVPLDDASSGYCNAAVSRAEAALAALRSMPQGEPDKWIDDPHDIEQGQMLNPEWVKAQEKRREAAGALGSTTENGPPSVGEVREEAADGRSKVLEQPSIQVGIERREVAKSRVIVPFRYRSSDRPEE